MIGILILNYKKYQVTADCIRSVLDTGDGLDYHIYVLDNGSGNDSIACLQAQFPNNPRITWMESAENTGYARGNNQMLSRARKDGCTAAVIANSDIVFLPGTLQQLAADIAKTPHCRSSAAIPPTDSGKTASSCAPIPTGNTCGRKLICAIWRPRPNCRRCAASPLPRERSTGSPARSLP